MLLLGLSGCPTSNSPKTRTPEDFGDATAGDEPVPIGEAKKKPAPATEDAPEISRSRGTKGGVIVLWPRVWPRKDEDPASVEIATRVQKRLEALSRRAAGSRSIEVRPSPERSCPQDGCEATSVSAVIVTRGKGCAVAALVGGPGKSPSRFVPWAGAVTFTSETVPFREPPEEQVKVSDYASCEKLLEGTEAQDAAIAKAITGLLPGG
jgi:hypothetical protein